MVIDHRSILLTSAYCGYQLGSTSVEMEPTYATGMSYGISVVRKGHTELTETARAARA
jgi:hypothetical protein